MVKIVGQILTVVIVAVVVAIIAFSGGIFYRKRIAEAQIGSAEERSRKIIEDAIKNGKKRELLLLS